MTAMTGFWRRGWLPLIITGLAGSFAGAGLAQSPAEDPGWTPVVAGAPPSMPPKAFEKAVVSDIPPELFDRHANFTTHEAYRPEANYKLVMVFHGAEDAPPTDQKIGRASCRERVGQYV